MEDYEVLYFKIDISLLACVFEIFGKESINYFELDPSHYLSTPGYSWNTMLRFTDVNLRLISDIEKYQFIERTIIGNISMICKGYSEANNKFLKSYNAKKPTSYIKYLDANELYEHSMKQLLPTEIFNWVNPKDFNLDTYSNDNQIGYFLEVNLDYYEELHDLHNDYPLAGEKVKVAEEILSDYQLKIIEDNNLSFGKNKKLIPNLDNKRKCKLRYQNLKLYLNLKLQLKKIHRN